MKVFKVKKASRFLVSTPNGPQLVELDPAGIRSERRFELLKIFISKSKSFNTMDETIWTRQALATIDRILDIIDAYEAAGDL